MRFAVVLAVAAACSPKPPREPPLDCTKPSRTCAYVATAKQTPDLDAFAAKKYGPYGATALAGLRARGFEALIVDLGVVLAYEQFAAFDAHTTDPWLARRRFSAKLGTRRVYRAVAVTDDTDRDMRARGMVAPPEGPGGVTTFPLTMHWFGSLGDRMHHYIAVHDSPDVARCIAHRYATEGQRVVVYALDLPVLDILALDLSANICRVVPLLEKDCSNYGSPRLDGQPDLCVDFYDAKIESYVAHRIEASEIASATPATSFDDCQGVFIAAARQAIDKVYHITPPCRRTPRE